MHEIHLPYLFSNASPFNSSIPTPTLTPTLTLTLTLALTLTLTPTPALPLFLFLLLLLLLLSHLLLFRLRAGGDCETADMITADPKRVKAAGDSFREMTSLGDKKPDQIQVRVRS